MIENYVIGITDYEFISGISYIVPGTQKIYLVEFSFKSPEGSDKRKIAEAFASANSRDMVKKLNLTQISKFTPNKSQAAKYDEAHINPMIEFFKRFHWPLPNEIIIESTRERE